MASELEQVKQYFDDRHVPLSMEWLESCIVWCKNDGLPPDYTLKTLQRMVFNQWLFLDLRDVEISSLPRNLSAEKKYSLSGIYYLQLMQVIDISKPKLWQLQRIRNNVARNTEIEKDFGKRVLQLTLTDGVQEIQAMEFKPIECLNINLIPGTKLKIIGPVMVRNGRLMLERDNVMCLGGSVDDLIVKYAAENVLARALGLEENPNPRAIDENILEVNQENANTQANTTSRQNASTTGPNTNQNQSRNNNLATAQVNFGNNHNVLTSSRNNIKQTVQNQEIPPEFEVDDELLRELEEDFEEDSVINFRKSIVSSRSQPQQPNPLSSTSHSRNTDTNRHCTSPDLFEEMEFDEELLNEHLDQIELEVNLPSTSTGASYANNSTKKLETQETKKSKPLQDSKVNTSKKNEEVITLDDSFDDIDIDSHLDHIDEEMAKLPCSTQKVKDFKDQVKSPELKKPTSTPRLSLPKTSATKMLTQSKLTFGKKNVASTSKGVLPLDDDDDDDFESPFTVFGKPAQKKPPGFVPLEIPDVYKKPLDPQSSGKLGSGGALRKSSIKALEAPSASNNSPNTLDKLGESSIKTKNPTLETPSTSNKSSSTSKSSANEIVSNPSPSALPKINVMSIDKLKKLLPNISKGKFKIKGQFVTVAEKLKTLDTSFYLAITVRDDSGELTVEIHSDIVSKLAKVTPERIAELRELAIKNDKAAAAEIFRTLKSLHAMCMALDNVLELQITRGEKYPVVINIIEEPSGSC